MDSTATDLFNLLVSRDYTVKTLTNQGKPETNPGDAEMFSFDFETSQNNYGTVVILLDDEGNFEVYYGDNVGKNMEGDDKDSWYDFLNQLKTFATRNLLTFTLKNLNKLKYSMQGMAAINEGLFEGWNGTKRTSYNDKPGTTRLKIVHSRELGEGEQRFRNIEKLYVENTEGERFKLPFTTLVGGRAMARHVAEGGTPYDVFGQHITDLVREANILSRFVRTTKTITEDDAEQYEVVSAGRDRYQTVRGRLKSLAGKRGYNAYKESWDPAVLEQDSAVVDALRGSFITKTVPTQIEEALPYIAQNLQPSQSKEPIMKEFDQFANWAENVTEGTWAIPDDEAKIKELKNILAQPLPVGTDAMNATGVLYDIIGDDELFDRLAVLAKQDPEADARPVIEDWIEEYSDRYHGLEDLAARVFGDNDSDELEVNEPVEEQLDIDTGKEEKKQERDAMLEMNAWRKLAGMQEKVYEDFTAFQEAQAEPVEEANTPLRDREDFLAKSKHLYNLMMDPNLKDQESMKAIQQRIIDLEREARELGLLEMTEDERAAKLNDDILGELNASDIGKEGVDWFAPADTEPYNPERDDPRDDPNYGFDRKPTAPQAPTAPTAPGLKKTQEGNAFSGALTQAKKTGAAEFEVDGKRYKVEEVDAGSFGQQDDDELGQGKNTDPNQIVPGHEGVKDEKLEEAPGDEQLPPGYSRVGPRGVLVGPSGNLSNWRDPNMDPDYWARDNMTKYDMDSDNEWDEIENWLSKGSYKAGNDLRRSMMLKKYGLDQGVTPEKLAAARSKADAIKKAAQDKEDKFYKDMEVARILGRDAGSTADLERNRAETNKELAGLRKNAGIKVMDLGLDNLTGKKKGLNVGQGWSDQMDIDDLDRVSAKYGTSPASDQTAALAHQEREFAPGSDAAWDQYLAKHGPGSKKSSSGGMNVYKDLAKVEGKETNVTEKKAKPDYLDFDKDGDRKESMKKALSDKKKKTNEETLDEAQVTKDSVAKLLVKYGNNPESVKQMIEKEFDRAVKTYPNATASKIAEIIRILAEESNLDERSLTKGEEKKREKYVKGMKKSKADFKKRYGDRGEEVMYATATKMAKEGETTGGSNMFGKGIYESLTELENDLDLELGHGITATSQLDEPENPVGMLEPTDVPVGIPSDMDVEIVSAEPKEKNLGDKIADKGAELSAQIDAALADIKRLAGMGN
jgi:hypothetical protein